MGEIGAAVSRRADGTKLAIVQWLSLGPRPRMLRYAYTLAAAPMPALAGLGQGDGPVRYGFAYPRLFGYQLFGLEQAARDKVPERAILGRIGIYGLFEPGLSSGLGADSRAEETESLAATCFNPIRRGAGPFGL
jgi:hypothetical protein